MDFTKIDVNELVTDLDAKRKELNLSYQNVADACNVSQSTIIRIFKKDSEPTLTVLQQIVSILEYEFVQAPIAPINASNEEYIRYLHEIIEFERKDKKIRLDQQAAKHNMAINQERREKRWWRGTAIALMGTFVALFFYDFTHLDRGWIQEYLKSHTTISKAYLAVRGWMEGKKWNA